MTSEIKPTKSRTNGLFSFIVQSPLVRARLRGACGKNRASSDTPPVRSTAGTFSPRGRLPSKTDLARHVKRAQGSRSIRAGDQSPAPQGSWPPTPSPAHPSTVFAREESAARLRSDSPRRGAGRGSCRRPGAHRRAQHLPGNGRSRAFRRRRRGRQVVPNRTLAKSPKRPILRCLGLGSIDRRASWRILRGSALPTDNASHYSARSRGRGGRNQAPFQSWLNLSTGSNTPCVCYSPTSARAASTRSCAR